MKVYYMVHNPDGTWPREKHETEFDAGKEAERQATANPGETFNVLKVIGSCAAREIKWEGDETSIFHNGKRGPK